MWSLRLFIYFELLLSLVRDVIQKRERQRKRRLTESLLGHYIIELQGFFMRGRGDVSLWPVATTHL